MGRHMQSVGDERDRAEQEPADDLGSHHEAAQRDHRPGAALVALVAVAQEDVAVKIGMIIRHHRSKAIAAAWRHSLKI